MAKQTITVIPGDGIGPDIIDATIKVLDKAGCDFEYEYADAGLTALENHGDLVPESTLALIEKNKITLTLPHAKTIHRRYHGRISFRENTFFRAIAKFFRGW